MTTWSQPRTITVCIPAVNKNEPNFLIRFKVEPAQKDNFSKLFENYLRFCHDVKSIVKVKDEIVDTDTGELCSITFELIGERGRVGPELQRISTELLKHCTRI